MAVFGAVDKVFEGEFRVGREGCAVSVLLGRRRSCGGTCGRCRGWFCTLFGRTAFHLVHHAAEIVGRKRVFDCDARILARCCVVRDRHVCGSGHGGCRRRDGGHGFTGNIAVLMLGSRHCGGSRRRRGDDGCRGCSIICRGALRCQDVERDRRKGDLFQVRLDGRLMLFELSDGKS